MAKGFGQYVEKSSTTARIEELKRRIVENGTSDPEDLMLMIMDALKEEVLYPEPGKFYTFVYTPKTPEIEYDQHPLIACTELYGWHKLGECILHSHVYWEENLYEEVTIYSLPYTN